MYFIGNFGGMALAVAATLYLPKKPVTSIVMYAVALGYLVAAEVFRRCDKRQERREWEAESRKYWRKEQA